MMDPMMNDVLRMAVDKTLASVEFPALHAPFRDAVHGVHAFGMDGAVTAVLALVEIAATKYVDIPAILTSVCDACPDIGSGTLAIMYIVINVVRDIYHMYADFVCEVRKHGGRGVVEAIIGEHIARRAAQQSSQQPCQDIVDALTVRLDADTAAEVIRDNNERFTGPSVPPYWLNYSGDKAAFLIDANWGTGRAAVDVPAGIAKMQSYAFMPQLGTFEFTMDGAGDEKKKQKKRVVYQVVVAGGCPAAALSFPSRGCGDIDAYVVCDNPHTDVHEAILVDVVKQFENRMAPPRGDSWKIGTVIMTEQAVTFNVLRYAGTAGNVPCCVQWSQVQFSMRVYPSVASILLSYDLTCVAVAFDGTAFILTPLALWSHIHRHVIVNPLIQSTPLRCCIKYPCRGFNVVVPVSAKVVSDVTERSRSRSRSRSSKLWRRTNTGAWNIAVFVCWKQIEDGPQERVGGGSDAQPSESDIRIDAVDEWGSDVRQAMDAASDHGCVPGETLFSTSTTRVFAGGSNEHHLDIRPEDILSGNDASVRKSWWASASNFYSDVVYL